MVGMDVGHSNVRYQTKPETRETDLVKMTSLAFPEPSVTS